MFCSNEHYMSISHIAIFVYMATQHKSFRTFNNPLFTEPKAPITIGTIVTFIYLRFFNSLARSRYLSFFSHSFRFILWSAGIANLTMLQILFFVDYYYYYYYYSFTVFYINVSWLFFTEFEWQQVSSSRQDSSQYSGRCQ